MVNIAEKPEGIEGEGFFLTSVSQVIGLARANSLWPLPFATSCCGIELMSVGACACSGGIFDTYSVLQGIDKVIPVDVYVPGCPPRPEQIIDGLIKIQEMVKSESIRRRDTDEYKKMLESYHIQTS